MKEKKEFAISENADVLDLSCKIGAKLDSTFYLKDIAKLTPLLVQDVTDIGVLRKFLTKMTMKITITIMIMMKMKTVMMKIMMKMKTKKEEFAINKNVDVPLISCLAGALKVM